MTGSLPVVTVFPAEDALPGGGLSWLLTHLAIDLVAVGVLVWWIFRRRHRDLDAPLILIALNLGLFAALACIASGEFSAGVGFGLFGLLSLVRLRSEAFSTSEMAYTFVSLVIALINGLPGRATWLPLSLTVLLVAMVAVVDHPRLRPRTRRVDMVLDRAFSSPDLARAEVAERMKVDVLDVSIREVDYVRETTRVAVRYLVETPRRDRRTVAVYGRPPHPAVSGGSEQTSGVVPPMPAESVVDVRYVAEPLPEGGAVGQQQYGFTDRYVDQLGDERYRDERYRDEYAAASHPHEAYGDHRTGR